MLRMDISSNYLRGCFERRHQHQQYCQELRRPMKNMRDNILKCGLSSGFLLWIVIISLEGVEERSSSKASATCTLRITYINVLYVSQPFRYEGNNEKTNFSENCKNFNELFIAMTEDGRYTSSSEADGVLVAKVLAKQWERVPSLRLFQEVFYENNAGYRLAKK
uniref:Uncharacterized protein n=1 Tax=Glossina palpalis gambiensis TaxID=67801 RepID=A0A1B0BFX2_9MUSC